MAGRFLPQRDLNVFERVNKELIGDLRTGKDGIINQQVVLYKVSVQDTKTNMYGESSGGKRWKDGVNKALWILFGGLAAVIIRLLTEVLQ